MATNAGAIRLYERRGFRPAMLQLIRLARAAVTRVRPARLDPPPPLAYGRAVPLRARLSYANVTATLALFVALGGSTYAATKIRGKDIAPRTITAKNVKRGTLTGKELARGAITAAKLSPALRALLPADDDFGDPGAEPLPGLDGPPGTAGRAR